MYHAATFNSRNLFQRLGGLLGAGASPAAQRCSSLLQRAHQAVFHLDEAERLQQLAHEQFARFSPQLGVAEARLHASSPIVSAVILHVSSGLGALRIMQNEGWKLLAAASGAVDTPSSMHDAYNCLARAAGSRKRPAWFERVPGALRDATLAYWENSGKTLAAHRDVDQHFNPIATGCFVRVEGGVVTGIEIVLPDNPEVKARSRHAYENRTSAVAFSTNAFTILHDLVETIAGHFGAAPTPLNELFEPHPRIEQQPGVERPTALWVTTYDGNGALLFGQTADLRVSIRPLHLPV